MNAHLFSAALGLLGALAIMGSLLFMVGGGLVLARAGENPFKILIPVYGPYRLARTAKVATLFWAMVLCAMATLYCWSLPTGALQKLGVLPLGLLWSCVVLAAVSAVECFHGSPLMVAAAIVAPPLGLLLAALGEKDYDPCHIPSLSRRLWKLEKHLSGPVASRPLPAGASESSPYTSLEIGSPYDAQRRHAL